MSLLEQGLTVGARRYYEAAQRKFTEFCQSQRIQPLPLTEEKLLLWLGKVDEDRMKATTVSTYLTAIRAMALDAGQDVPILSEWRLLRRARRALARKRAEEGAPTRRRLALTTEVMAKIRPHIVDGSLTGLAVWAALALGVYKMLRMRQVVYNGRFGQHSYPRASSVKVHRKHIELLVPSDKTDLGGGGKYIILDKAGGVTCPVEAFKRYWESAELCLPPPSGNAAVFRARDGKPLSESLFKRRVNAALRKAGYDLSRYRGFSLRRGGATTAHHAGLDVPTIKSIGGWKSNTVLRYIDVSRATSRRAARHMAV